MHDLFGPLCRPLFNRKALGLRAKIACGLLAIAMLVVAVGSVSIWVDLRIRRQAEQVSNYSGPALLSVEQMISEALRIQDNTLGLTLLHVLGGQTFTVPEHEFHMVSSGIVAGREAFLTALQDHQRLVNEGGYQDEIPFHDDASSAFESYYQAVVDIVYESDPNRIPALMAHLKEQEAHLLGVLEILFDDESKRLIDSQHSLADNADRLVLLNVVVIVLSLVMALLIALRISNAITWPLNRLQAAASQIGSGRYLSEGGDNPLHGIDSKDEIGSLAEAFKRMSNDLKRLTNDLHYSAYHDALTGLANRKSLIDYLDVALMRAREFDEGSALLFMDFDRFKAINDFHGHSVGDELLIATAGRLKSCLRKHDLVARLGGDEFTILIDHSGEVDFIIDLTRRLLDTIAQPFQLLDGELEVRLTASVGLVLIDASFASTTDILRDADLAMYRAKTGGAGRFELFTEELRSAALTTMQLETDLRQVLEAGELGLHYQPIVSVEGGETVGLEALARWVHPELGFIPPDRFIPIAEESGLIIELDRFILLEASRQIAEWNTLLGTDLSISVNLSGQQFASASLIDNIGSVLRETGLQPHLLHLEITETMLMQNSDRTQVILAQLRDLGVALHMDDFGTGYSSLAYLQRFDVDTLKIDRNFIDQMLENEENGALVTTILAMAQALHLQVVAEGVETEAQQEHLRRLGCEFAQGYLISRPLPAAEMQLYLEAHVRQTPIAAALTSGAGL